MKICFRPTEHQHETKKYQHDCMNCLFLGVYHYDAPHAINDGSGRKEYTVPFSVDLYYCPGKTFMGSCIARYGDRPEQYASSAVDILETQIDSILKTPNNELGTFTMGYVEAFLRAKKEGLYPDRSDKK